MYMFLKSFILSTRGTQWAAFVNNDINEPEVSQEFRLKKLTRVRQIFMKLFGLLYWLFLTPLCPQEEEIKNIPLGDSGIYAIWISVDCRFPDIFLEATCLRAPFTHTGLCDLPTSQKHLCLKCQWERGEAQGKESLEVLC